MFSNENLKSTIAGKPIGDVFPYDTGDPQEIEGHIRRLFYRLLRIPNLVCEADWDHFGSGYASFVEFFCYEKVHVSVIGKSADRREEKREGLIVDVCRLAPAVIIGGDVRYRTIDEKTNEEISGSYGSLLDGPYRLTLPQELQPLAAQIAQALQEFSFEMLPAEKLAELLPFSAKIPTLYRKPKDYLKMDALFYWED